jgi:hypothetical protein
MMEGKSVADGRLWIPPTVKRTKTWVCALLTRCSTGSASVSFVAMMISFQSVLT